MSKGRFPLGKILRAKRNFSLFVNSEPEKDKEKFRSTCKILHSGKQALMGGGGGGYRTCAVLFKNHVCENEELSCFLQFTKEWY